MHRALLDNPIARKAEYAWLWVRLLLKANYKETKFVFNNKVEILKPGQLLTGRKKLSKETGIKETQVYKILNFLEKEQQIEQQKTNKFTVITIRNWGRYQQEKQQKEQPSDNQATTKRQPSDTYKNIKKEKKDNKKIYIAVIDYLNRKTGKKFKTTRGNIKWVEVRLNEGYTLEDFKKVIDIKTSQWKNDPDNNRFLRPETLFGNKFDGYLNEKVTPKGTDKVAGIEAYKEYKFETIDSKMPKGFKDSEQYKRIKKL